MGWRNIAWGITFMITGMDKLIMGGEEKYIWSGVVRYMA